MSSSNTVVHPKEVLQVLQALSSQDPRIIKSAEERLKQIGEQLGTWDIIHQYAAQKDLPLDLRKQALIQFKNSVVPRWRSKKLLTDEQRANVRARSFSFLEEQDDTLSETNAVVISKIARADFPAQWPSLTHDCRGLLEAQIQAQAIGPNISLRRTLRIISFIVKEMSSMKMLTGVKGMQQLIDDWLTSLLQCYSSTWQLVEPFITTVQRSDPAISHNILILHLIFKPVSRMSVWLWSRMDKPAYNHVAQTLQEIFESYRRQWIILSDIRSSKFSSFHSSTLQALTKHIVGITKTFRKWQRISPDHFLELPDASSFVLAHWQIVLSASELDSSSLDESNNSLHPIKLIITGLALVKESISRWSSPRLQSTPVLDQQFVQRTVDIVVTRLLPLKPADLARWEEEPEEWATGEEIDEEAWEFGIRPCSERVIIVLTRHYPQFAVPALQHIFENALASGNVLIKEAVYCAVGSCAPYLRESIDFSKLLQEQLSREVLAAEPVYRILKRRIAWLIGKWVESVENEPTTLMWEILSGILTGRNLNIDPAVQLSAMISSKQCANSSKFNKESLRPFLADTIHGLLQIAMDSNAIETKQKALSALDVVIGSVGVEIAPLTEKILQIATLLWTQADECNDFLIKGCLLSTLTLLVESLGTSQSLCSILVSLIQECLSPKNRAALVEDALELWLATLRNSSYLGSEPSGFLDLFPIATHYLSEDLDTFGAVLLIIESYLLLDANLIMTRYSQNLLTTLRVTLERLTGSNIKDLMRLVNLVFSLTPITSWAPQLLSSGLLALILKNVLEDKLSAVILTEHIYALARLSLSDAQTFLQLVSAIVQLQHSSETAVLNDLLDQWWLKFDNMSEPGNRKLTAMGVACLVATGRDEVLQRLSSEIFNLWLDCFGEIREAEINKGSGLALHWQTGEAALLAFLRRSEGTLEESRRRQRFTDDPIQQIKLTSFVKEKLAVAQANAGGPTGFKARYLASADPLLVQQIERELSA